MKKLVSFIFAVIAIFFAADFSVITAYCEESNFHGKAAFVMDYDTGTCIYSNCEDRRLPIASMTKIMLLDIVFENIEKGVLSADEYITVSENASSMGGSQVFLQANKKYLVNDLIKSVIVASANDASVALAEKICGTESAFVELMNENAKKMGLSNTLFSNCTGLPKPTQYSSAKDVAVMLKSLLRHEDYYKFSKIWLDEIVHPDGSKTVLTNTNKLVRNYDGCDGGKTGFTNESMYCLAATAKRGATRLIAVVIGEKESNVRFNDVKGFFDVGFATYATKIVVDKNLSLDEKLFVPFAKNENVDVFPRDNLCGFCKINEKADFTYEVSLTDKVSRDVKSGDKVGEIVLFKNGIECSRTDVIIKEEIERMDYFDALGKVCDNW